MTETCSECGNEMNNGGSPMSAMGESMYRRCLDEYYCDNPICPRFGR
jgi:hypothetical protein